MDAAIARHERKFSGASKDITAVYDPDVGTTTGNFDGTIRFGAPEYMTERAALHEIGHTLGVGTSAGFDANCKANDWPLTSQLVHSFDGFSVEIKCGGGNFWPYGLNYESEMSEDNADRHVSVIRGMLSDGIGS